MEHPVRSPWRDFTAFAAGAGLGLALIVTGEYVTELTSTPSPLLTDEAWEFQPRPRDSSGTEGMVNPERLPELAGSAPPVPASQRQVRTVNFLPNTTTQSAPRAVLDTTALGQELAETEAQRSRQVNARAPAAGASNLDERR